MTSNDRPQPRTRRPILLSVLVLGALGVLVSLGVWQLQRRAWKADLLARFDRSLHEALVPYAPPLPSSDGTQREFEGVRLTGHYVRNSGFRVYTPTPKADAALTKEPFGYFLFALFAFDGGAVFVNRGFAPDQAAGSILNTLPEGQVELVGMIRMPQPPGLFTPPAQFADRLFFTSDIAAMAAAFANGAGPIVTSEYIDAFPPPESRLAGSSPWPRPRDPAILRASIPNDHLQYAITWFALAAGLAIVAAIFFIRPRPAL